MCTIVLYFTFRHKESGCGIGCVGKHVFVYILWHRVEVNHLFKIIAPLESLRTNRIDGGRQLNITEIRTCLESGFTYSSYDYILTNSFRNHNAGAIVAF